MLAIMQRSTVWYQIVPLELDSCCTIAATSVAVRPDLFAAEFMKPVIAVARPLVPAVDDIMVGLIIPPIEIGPEPFLPSIIPSDASLIMAVTNADVFAIHRSTRHFNLTFEHLVSHLNLKGGQHIRILHSEPAAHGASTAGRRAPAPALHRCHQRLRYKPARH